MTRSCPGAADRAIDDEDGWVPDPIFPALHVRPPHGWLNDPNGACRIDGRWHLFFQYNPDAPVHTSIQWGHVSSEDLLSWREHPVALRPRPGGPDAAGCWSGCVIDDHGVPTAVYTANPGHAADATVALATSDRALEDWEQLPNPVVGTPVHPSVSEARDPFLFDFDGHRYAIQGCGRADASGTPLIMVYRCDDLHRWEELGPLISTDDPVAAAVAGADIWECPGLVRLGARWVLVISLWRFRDGNGELAGVRWLLGDLHSEHDRLRFAASAGGDLDSGPAHYAPHLLAVDGRALAWAWSWELDRTPAQIAETGWAGVITFPRELSVSGNAVQVHPAAELLALRRDDLGVLDTVDQPAFELLSDHGVALALRTGDHLQTVVDPERLGDAPMRILVDGSLVEVFVEGRSFTTRAYPDAASVWMVSEPVQVYRLGLPATR